MSRTTGVPATWRAFLGAPGGVISVVLLGVLIMLAIPGPNGFGSSATAVNVDQASQGPGDSHLLGTDSLGRDILLRTLAATRLTITVGVTAVAIAVVAGGIVGALLAVGGPTVRRVGASAIDIMLGVGDYLLAIVVVTILGVGAHSAVIAVGVAFAPGIARFVFTLVSSVVVRDYVAAARVLGVRPRGILRRYILRNSSDPLAVTIFGAVGEGIVALSALSFLGLGVQAPQFDWGTMLTDGVKGFYFNPWAALAPAIMILVTGLAMAMFGDALARALNPILRSHATTPRPNAVGPAIEAVN